MNRSYSKIRHIQESNIRLEKRVLNEQQMSNFLNLPNYATPTNDKDCLDKKIKEISPNASFEIITKILTPYEEELSKLIKGGGQNLLQKFKEIIEKADKELKRYNLNNEIILKIHEECGLTKKF